MTSIRILETCWTEETSIPDPEDRWDRASTSSSHSIEGFEVDVKWNDLTVSFEPDFNVPYFLLYAVYSTGDSFGHDAGANIEYFGLFEKYETAKLNEKRLKTMTDGGPCTLLTDFGIDFDIFIPWFGYFERLDYIDIEKVQRNK